MKLSLRSEYALLALIYMARSDESVGPASLKSIAHSQQIPAASLAEVLTVLVCSKHLSCTKGRYQLAVPPEKISVADIIRLFDGAFAPLEPVSEKGYAPAPMEREQKLTDLFSGLQEQIVCQLENTTLADLS